MDNVIAVFALIPLVLVVVVAAWVYRRRDDEPRWRH
jgi:hypothetical protein